MAQPHRPLPAPPAGGEHARARAHAQAWEGGGGGGPSTAGHQVALWDASRPPVKFPAHGRRRPPEDGPCRISLLLPPGAGWGAEEIEALSGMHPGSPATSRKLSPVQRVGLREVPGARFTARKWLFHIPTVDRLSAPATLGPSPPPLTGPTASWVGPVLPAVPQLRRTARDAASGTVTNAISLGPRNNSVWQVVVSPFRANGPDSPRCSVPRGLGSVPPKPILSQLESSTLSPRKAP